MNSIRHFTWQFGREAGRMAVAMTELGRVEIAQIKGNAPHVAVVLAALARCPEVIRAANAANAGRKHRAAIACREGMSGALDIRLIEERQHWLADYPTVAVCHVSMYGKLNAGLYVWAGDLPLIVWGLWEHATTPEQVAEAAADLDENRVRTDYEFRDWPGYGLAVREDGILAVSPEANHSYEVRFTLAGGEEYAKYILPANQITFFTQAAAEEYAKAAGGKWAIVHHDPDGTAGIVSSGYYSQLDDEPVTDDGPLAEDVVDDHEDIE